MIQYKPSIQIFLDDFNIPFRMDDSYPIKYGFITPTHPKILTDNRVDVDSTGYMIYINYGLDYYLSFQDERPPIVYDTL
jgi:hypothetical protein